VDVEDEDVTSRCAMEAIDRDGIKEMPTATPDPPEEIGSDRTTQENPEMP
jgi:hypothetical protein